MAVAEEKEEEGVEEPGEGKDWKEDPVKHEKEHKHKTSTHTTFVDGFTTNSSSTMATLTAAAK